MSNRSGTSRSYAERAEAGRPNRTFSLAAEIDAEISALAHALRVSRSRVVEMAVEQLSHTIAPKSADPVE